MPDGEFWIAKAKLFGYTFTMLFIIIAALIGLCGLAAVFFFCKLADLRNQCRLGYAQMEVQRKSLHTLIASFVNDTKPYFDSENGLVRDVLDALRASVKVEDTSSGCPFEQEAFDRASGCEKSLNGAVARLWGAAKSCQALKEDHNAQQLFKEMAVMESTGVAARQAYNDACMEYNAACESFPGIIVAQLCDFRAAASFDSRDSER